MVEFINYLRVFATILITNSHYAGIWPVSAMASGGLLGNIIFFAASGFCLFKIKENFGKWFLKRFLRIYPVMILFTLLMWLVGPYSQYDTTWLFLFPTHYVFIVWIMACYVVYYVVAYFQNKYPNKKIAEFALIGILLAHIAVYLIFVDKSAYVIDQVEQPFILFLYMMSMLMGALLRKYQEKFKKLKWYTVALAVVFVGAYFASKFVLDRYSNLAFLQIFNQYIILGALFFIFTTFMGLEEKLQKLNGKWKGVIKFIASLTLHIYIVQYVIIGWFSHLVFPLNFFVVTALILVMATALYFAEKYIKLGIVMLVKLIKEKCLKNNTQKETITEQSVEETAEIQIGEEKSDAEN